MEYIKFSGLMRKIQENYKSGFDLVEFLQKELDISQKKSLLLAEKISKIYDFELDNKIRERSISEETEETPKKEDSKRFNIYSLDNLSGRAFEEFLKWLFQELGYTVELTKLTADSGVDLVIEKDKEKIAVQAKRYNRYTKVSNGVILKTHGGMGVYKCNKSIIITTSYFTNQAKSDANKLNMELWDRDVLSAKIDEVNNELETDIHKIEFPEYSNSLYDSLKKLSSMDIFVIKNGGNGRHDICRHGLKYPLLSFRYTLGSISHLSFRIKNNEPIPEYGTDSWSLITSDRGSIYGPTEKSAYNQIIQYLSNFV